MTNIDGRPDGGKCTRTNGDNSFNCFQGLGSINGFEAFFCESDLGVPPASIPA